MPHFSKVGVFHSVRQYKNHLFTFQRSVRTNIMYRWTRCLQMVSLQRVNLVQLMFFSFCVVPKTKSLQRANYSKQENMDVSCLLCLTFLSDLVCFGVFTRLMRTETSCFAGEWLLLCFEMSQKSRIPLTHTYTHVHTHTVHTFPPSQFQWHICRQCRSGLQ